MDKDAVKLFEELKSLHDKLDSAFQIQFERSLPFGENFVDRWERASKLGFGIGTSIYDSAMVLGNVTIGSDTWVGPNSIIDGSGGLTIGNNCTISAGVHIYTHDNVKQTLTSGTLPIERQPVAIGNNVYLGPNAIITKDVTIGNNCVIGAFAFINKPIPDNSIVMGQPGKIVGKVIFEKGEPNFVYSEAKRF